MKKVLGIITSIFLLSISAGQSHAATLESWNYTLSNVQISERNTDFGYQYTSGFTGKNGFTYKSGDNWHSIEPKRKTDITGQDTVSSSGLNNIGNNDALLRYDTSAYSGIASNTSTKIANLSFTYSASPVGSSMGLTMTYTLPLYSYYDATTKTSYVYYSNDEVISTGKNSQVIGGNLYIALGFNLYVDGRALVPYEAADGKSYTGWAINEDTQNNTYDSYVVGGENISTGLKEWQNSFDITSEFYTLSYPLTSGIDFEQQSFKASYIGAPTTPTPEPATMLLMGIGLAALGFRVRSKNK